MAQFARPDEDITKGNWDDLNGNNNDILYDDIDEVTPSDADYIQSPDDPSAEECEVGLESLTDPVGNTGHVVRYRYRAGESGGGGPSDIDFTVKLMEGATQRASWLLQPNPPSDYALAEQTLTTGEADSISDYTDLRLRFLANKTGGARVPWIEVSWAEFEVPDASQTFYQNTGQGATAIAGTLGTVKTGVQAVGGHAMVIAGTLSTVATWYKAVGGYAMTITGVLSTVKTGFQAVGGHAMTITGDCSPAAVILQNVGQGAVAIAGVLSTALIQVQAVGQGAVAIVGTLATSFIAGAAAAAGRYFIIFRRRRR